MKVAIPIENKVRDLRGFVWLALHVTNHGHEVTLGETAAIRNGLDVIEPDVWVRGGLSRSRQKIKLARHLTEAGGALVIVETEGALIGDHWYKENEINKQMSKHVTTHCTWGTRQAELLNEQLRDYDNIVRVTGNPRFDLLTPKLRGIYKQEANNYNEMYNKYILVATNFTIVNKDDGTRESEDQQRADYQEQLMSEYIDAVHRFTSDLNCNIIIRPHPRENITTYRDHFSNTDSVYVIREGSVRPWILGARAVVHKSSTTGIESALLDTPVFTYRPLQNQRYDAALPILVSEEATEYSDLCQALRETETGEPRSLSSREKKILHQNFHNFEEPVAGPTIAKAIDKINTSENVTLDQIDRSLEFKLKRIGVRMFGGNFVETVGESVFGTDRSGLRNKFPGLTIRELQSEIELVNSVSIEEFPDVTVSEVPGLINAFSIEPVN